MDISDVLTLARELNLTHIANGEVDLTMSVFQILIIFTLFYRKKLKYGT